MGDEIRRRVIDALEAGRLPRGGPSDAAAHDLFGELPGDYWERWGAAAAERMRARRPRCLCADGGAEPVGDGRCSRCWGWGRRGHGRHNEFGREQ